jgi:hypothetical protein
MTIAKRTDCIMSWNSSPFGDGSEFESRKAHKIDFKMIGQVPIKMN